MIVGEDGPELFGLPTIPVRDFLNSCGRQVPYTSHGRGYYFQCDLPHGHDGPCSGRATDWGAPTL